MLHHFSNTAIAVTGNPALSNLGFLYNITIGKEDSKGQPVMSDDTTWNVLIRDNSILCPSKVEDLAANKSVDFNVTQQGNGYLGSCR